MPRRPNIMKPTRLETKLPEDVRSRLDLHLFSQVEQRIPVGAYQRFFLERIREFFDSKAVDISQYFGRPAGSLVVKGSAETCQLVTAMILSTSEELAAQRMAGG